MTLYFVGRIYGNGEFDFHDCHIFTDKARADECYRYMVSKHKWSWIIVQEREADEWKLPLQ